jgi:hypothetical protein
MPEDAAEHGNEERASDPDQWFLSEAELEPALDDGFDSDLEEDGAGIHGNQVNIGSYTCCPLCRQITVDQDWSSDEYIFAKLYVHPSTDEVHCEFDQLCREKCPYPLEAGDLFMKVELRKGKLDPYCLVDFVIWPKGRTWPDRSFLSGRLSDSEFSCLIYIKRYVTDSHSVRISN